MRDEALGALPGDNVLELPDERVRGEEAENEEKGGEWEAVDGLMYVRDMVASVGKMWKRVVLGLAYVCRRRGRKRLKSMRATA